MIALIAQAIARIKFGRRIPNLPKIESSEKTSGYCSDGNATKPATLGPIIKPTALEEDKIDMARGIFVSSERSAMMDFEITTRAVDAPCKNRVVTAHWKLYAKPNASVENISDAVETIMVNFFPFTSAEYPHNKL